MILRKGNRPQGAGLYLYMALREFTYIGVGNDLVVMLDHQLRREAAL